VYKWFFQRGKEKVYELAIVRSDIDANRPSASLVYNCQIMG
jgi:hypothetical protein